MFFKQVFFLHCTSVTPVLSALHEMERLEKESGRMHACTADPLTACCSADCRHALRSESRPGLWEHGNSESPEEEDRRLYELGQPLEGEWSLNSRIIPGTKISGLL